ncbi:MAG: MFS transporter [Bacillota bacterium]|nr:MFS transporter [Bacillota bacterium]
MPESSLWNRNYIILTVTNLLFFLSFQMVVPVLPLYISSLGAGDVIVGLIVGAGTLGGLFARPLAGKISDRYARLPVYYFGLILCAVMIFAYPFCVILPLLFCLRLLHGFSMGITTTSSNTIVADILPHSRFTEGMGYFGMGSVLAMAFAPVIALYLAEHMGFSVSFHASFVIVLITIVISIFIKGKDISVVKQKSQEKGKKEGIYELKALPAAVLLAVQSCGYCAVVTYIALYGEELDISGVGIFFSVYSAFVVLCRLTAGKLADRKGFGAVLIPALLVSSVGYLVLGMAHSLAVLLVGAALLGVGFGSAFPTFQAMALRDAPQHRHGAATATVMSGFDIGFGLGAVIWGFVAQVMGYAALYYINALLILVSLLVYCTVVRASRQAVNKG